MEHSGSERPALLVALETVIAPLVEADGGELYLLPDLHPGVTDRRPVEGTGDRTDPAARRPGPIRLHLGGRFSGCPGNSLVTEHIIRPVLEPIAVSRPLEISSGRLVPAGAERIVPRP
jgi:hypothetical protein